MTGRKMVSFHVDMDSPCKLLKFYGLEGVEYSARDLDQFFETAMKRALELFRRNNICATFFCVGEDLEDSRCARETVREAFSRGHEIANHTYSHVYGLTRLREPEIISEIQRCTDAIQRTIGIKPAGFRSPGYDIDNRIMGILDNLDFKYDSSGSWSILNPVVKAYHKIASRGKAAYCGLGSNSSSLPRYPYFPSPHKWLKETGYRKIAEVPLPRTRICNLPFYGNFHLMMPPLYVNSALNKMDCGYFVYLFHIIEFVDMSDGIPKELCRHPNVDTAFEKKLKFFESLVKRILKKYSCVRTDKFVETMSKG